MSVETVRIDRRVLNKENNTSGHLSDLTNVLNLNTHTKTLVNQELADTSSDIYSTLESNVQSLVPYYVVSTTISAADVLTSYATPVDVVTAAQLGNGPVIFLGATVQVGTGTTAYTVTNVTGLQLKQDSVQIATSNKNVLSSAAAGEVGYFNLATGSVLTANQKITFSCSGTGNPTLGDYPITVSVAFVKIV